MQTGELVEWFELEGTAFGTIQPDDGSTPVVLWGMVAEQAGIVPCLRMRLQFESLPTPVGPTAIKIARAETLQ